MKLPSLRVPARWRRVSRGQAMVEFALILPVLVLLLVLAVDFGRVFYGWVALNNATRIAASSAAMNPDTWDGSGTVAAKDAYRLEVLRDLSTINCEPPSGGAWKQTDIPDPAFTDVGGTADPYELGDRVTVQLTCNFKLVTPIVGGILGSPFTFNAESAFAVRGGIIEGVPVGGSIPAPPTCIGAVVPNMVGMSVASARSAWTSAGFIGAFTPDTTAGKDAETVASQATTPSSNVGNCLTKSATVTVTSNPVTTCTAPDISVPNLVGMTVQAARSTWTSRGFTGAFSPSTGSDTDQVDSQTVSAGVCRPPTTTISVAHSAPPPPPPAMCKAPQLIGVKVNSGEADFRTAGFTGTFTKQPAATGNTDYKIEFQSLVGGQMYPCTSDIEVGPVQQP